MTTFGHNASEHTPMARTTLTAGGFTIERHGYDARRGHHPLRAALELLLDRAPTPPGIRA
jgi:hypothetical protein